MINEDNAQRMRLAFLELLWRNPTSHGGQAYELDLALWGLGLKATMPSPETYGVSRESFELEAAAKYAKNLSEIKD